MYSIYDVTYAQVSEILKTMNLEWFCECLTVYISQMYNMSRYVANFRTPIYAHIYAEFCEYDCESHTCSSTLSHATYVNSCLGLYVTQNSISNKAKKCTNFHMVPQNTTFHMKQNNQQMSTYFELRNLLLDGTDLSWCQAEAVQPVLHHLQPVRHFLHTRIHSIISKL